MDNPLEQEGDGSVNNDMAPKQNAKGRFGGLALIMVALNGLIMTLTAFMTLNSLVNGIISENLLRIAYATQTEIEESIQKLNGNVAMLSDVIAMNEYEYNEKVKDVLHSHYSPIDSFDKVFWIYKDIGEWRIHKIKHDSNSDTGYDSFLNSPNKDLIDYVVRQEYADGYEYKFLTELKGARAYTSDDSGLYRAAGYIHVLDVEGDVKGYVFATFHMQKLLKNILKNNQSIVNLNIGSQNITGNTSLLRYTNQALSEQGRTIYNPESIIFDVAGQQLTIESSYMISARESYMLKIPLLVLFFGIILTVIGALYIRGTANQSSRLSVINKELAQKNYDLNTQMKESTRLNKIVKKSERENKAIINSISDAIFEVDQSGVIQFINNTWFNISGHRVEDSIERNIFSFITADNRATQKRMFDDLLNGEASTYRSQTQIQCVDNELRSVEIGVSMLRHDEEKQLRAVGFIHDVEDRRRTEFALNEAERKYKTIVENIAGGIYQLSSEGKYLSANPAMAKILGYEDAAKMIAAVHDVNELVYKDVRKRLRYLRELESFQELQTTEFQVYTKGGGLIWVQESARAVYDENNDFAYYEGSVNDITERKGAEEKLNEAKVESDLASRAKSEFLTNMSHELRTPLNAIIGFSEIIKNETFGPVGGKEYLDYSNDIYEGGKQLLNIINEILDVSRIEAGERVLNEGIVSLHAVIENCIKMSAGKIVEEKLVVTNMVPEDFLSLIGEELGMKQMVMNLLSNAIKFTSANGRITVGAEVNDNGDVRLSITDTGVGMDEGEVEKALSPFGQVGNKLSKSTAGTGLGLTLVESLARLHESRLELLSQKGIGTTATLIFPARRVAKQGGSRAYEALSIDREDYDPKSLN